MPYFAQNRTCADNGLQFWQDTPHDLKTHYCIFSLGQFVLIPLEGSSDDV